jgi:hypothetical protein
MTPDLPYFQQAYYGPDATRVMGAAFDKACQSLHDAGQPNIVKEAIAKRIISLARKCERDPDRLCDETLKTLGYRRSFTSAG